MSEFCSRCDSTDIVRELGDYPFLETGLDSVVLRGVELLRCGSCGAVEPLIPATDAILGLIAKALIHKPRPLVGAEIRFLRLRAGKASQDFAELLGVTRHHYSKLENGLAQASGSLDRLVRFVASADAHDRRSMPTTRDLREIAKGRERSRLWVDARRGTYEFAAAD